MATAAPALRTAAMLRDPFSTTTAPAARAIVGGRVGAAVRDDDDLDLAVDAVARRSPIARSAVG